MTEAWRYAPGTDVQRTGNCKTGTVRRTYRRKGSDWQYEVLWDDGTKDVCFADALTSNFTKGQS